ncbi:hypothetical protein GCM10027596_25580 [Nocardioides korecus]
MWAGHPGDVVEVWRWWTGRGHRHRTTGLLLALVALAAVLLAVPSAHAEPGAPVTQPGSVVVVGATRLAWGSVDPQHDPALFSLVRRGAVGTLTTRASTDHSCTTDTWLTLSAGSAATTGHAPGRCTAPPEVVAGAPPASAARVAPPWSTWRRVLLHARPPASLGSVASRLAGTGQCVAAAGPAAALGAAATDGTVATWTPDPASLDLGACPVSLVSLPAWDDAVLGGLLARLPTDATVVVAGTGDDTGPTTVHTLVVAGPGVPHGVLTSGSTRQRGLVTVPDLSALLLDRLPTPPTLRIGRLPTVQPLPTAAAVASVHDLSEALDVEHPFVPTFFGLFLGGSLAVLLAGVLRWLVLARHPDTHGRRHHRRLRLWFALVGAMCASMPVATFLAGTVPWWRTTHPRTALCLAVVVASALLATLALAGPWRREPTGPTTFLITATWVVIGVDVLRGSALQLVSVMGLQPAYGGRYFGMGNVGAAVWLTASLLMATAYAQRLLLRGHRRTAVATVVLVGTVTLVVDSVPWWGAKAGAMLALVPAFSFLALHVAGVRLRARVLAAVVVLTGVVAVGFGALDYLRPVGERTHIGTTVADVLNGNLGGLVDVVRLNWIMLTSSWWNASVLALVVVLLALLVRPRWVARPLGDLLAAYPLLGTGLAAVVLCWLLAFVSEDSGTGIPPTGLLLLAPLLTLLASRTLPRPPAAA